MKLRKEQLLIRNFMCLKCSERFTLETLEKANKIMYNMQKYNVISAFSMWKDLVELSVANKFALENEFNLFVINSLISFFNISDFEFVILMVLSLEPLSQCLVTNIFINPKYESNITLALIYKLLSNRLFEYEKEVLICIEKYSLRLYKSAFNLNDFLESVVIEHLKNKSFSDLSETEVCILELIIKLYRGNKKKLISIIYITNDEKK